MRYFAIKASYFQLKYKAEYHLWEIKHVKKECVYTCVCLYTFAHVCADMFSLTLIRSVRFLFADKTTWAQRSKVELVSDSAWS